MEYEKKRYTHYAGRRKGDFYIDEIIYGGSVISNQKVYDKLLDFAVSGKSFTIGNDLFGTDPWKGVKKTFTATFVFLNVAEYTFYALNIVSK